MKRRTFVHGIGGAAVMGFAGNSAAERPSEWIDCNVTLGTWPFRRLASEPLSACAKQFVDRGVSQAWTARYEAIFRHDLKRENALWRETCREEASTLFLPVGTINPSLPDWRSDLLHCRQQLSLSIVRLYPNYHGYRLDEALFVELLDLATKLEIAVQIVAQIEDERTQPIKMQVPPVDLRPLPMQMMKVPKGRVMVLNAIRAQLAPILASETILIDIAKLDGVGVLEQLLETVSDRRIVFGSHAPFFYWDAARLKLQESELLDRQLGAILSDNATRWLGS